MTVRDFTIKCPMCNGFIKIDARNGKIVRHWEESEREEDDKPDPAEFDAAMGKVAKLKEEGDSTFSEAMKKVSERKKGLNDLFKEAKKKADEKGDEERPEDRKDFWD
jgi:predicted CopG family antitoxin